MNVLVVGGAGYVGSHMMKSLTIGGHVAVAYDNLSTGHHESLLYGEFIEGDLSDVQLLRSVFRSNRFDAVMNFASSIEVSESLLNPRKYYNNNVVNALNLIHCMMDQGVDNLIFSSSAAVYGSHRGSSIDESAQIRPVSPYGRTKAVIETILSDYREAYGFSSTSLRYFNAAGADPDGELGEKHDPESHLIPLAIQAALGYRDSMTVFGRDYDTKDGTCVRDFVHVTDLCDAHLLALNELVLGSRGDVYNLGNGFGYSVLEILDTVQKVSGRKFSVINADRRSGDPEILVAKTTKATEQLGWTPRYSDITTIVSTAWNFYSALK